MDNIYIYSSKQIMKNINLIRLYVIWNEPQNDETYF